MKPEIVNPKIKDCKVRTTYVGVLDTHWETGYEGTTLLHLYLDQDYSTLNPQYDPKDPNKGPEFYRSYEGMVTFDFADQIEIIDCKIDPSMNGKKFTTGNMKTAAIDNYRFGRVYPVEENEIDLKTWIKLFSAGTTKAKVHKLIRSVRLYGGTFDPIHKGHEQIINDAHYGVNKVLVLVGDNWTKKNKPIFTLDERLNATKAVCKQFHNVEVLDWAKENDTSSTFEIAEKIKEIYGFYPQIVIGSDNVAQLPKWKHWDQLKNLMFAIIPRDGSPAPKEVLDQINYLPFNKVSGCSSTAIREDKLVDHIPEAAKKCLDLRKISK